jgi:hypothetical protein
MPHECINESRIRLLEIHEATQGQEIKNLIEKMDALMSWIKALMIMFLTSSISVIGYLIVKWVEK